MAHKHCEMIKLWADGAIIQFKTSSGKWVNCKANKPAWGIFSEYRVKPIDFCWDNINPKWKYLAMDGGGGWYFYESLPKVGCEGWTYTGVYLAAPDTLYTFISVNWKDSLICRE